MDIVIVFDSIKEFFKKLIRHLNVKVALVIVVVLSVVSLLLQYFHREDSISFVSVAGAVVIPFQEGVNEIGKFLFDRESERKAISEAKAKIDELTEENKALKREIDELGVIRQENAEYRKLLNARERLAAYDVRSASVIGNDGVNVFRRFTVNLGSVDGIEKDMNVINSDGGLVGLVSFVGLNYSIVTSIIESGVSISAMTKNGNGNCILTGTETSADHSLLKLENALASVDFTNDGTLVTSNISDRYLPNILVGYVTEVNLNRDGLTQSGFVRTAVDFTSLREVLIIRGKKEAPNE